MAGDEHAELPSYEERLDPLGKLREAEQLAVLLRNPLTRSLIGAIGGASRDPDVRARELLQELDRIRGFLDGLGDVQKNLAPLRWCVFSSVGIDQYARAAELAAAGDADGADSLLTEWWNEPRRLWGACQRIKTLYDAEDERRRHRWRHLDAALKIHEAGLWAGSITVTLSLLEGVVRDISQDTLVPYRRGSALSFSDSRTVAGHPASLPVLVALLGEREEKTSAQGALSRNAIMHGRELAYDTRVNSTKALVALLAYIEWAQPIVRERREQELREREEKYAGSNEVDEHGRRLDRRGFDATKKRLEKLHLWQHGRLKGKRSYTTDLRLLDRRGELAVGGMFVALWNGGSGYWAWERTKAGWVFGIAVQDEDYVGWHYSAANPPAGPPGEAAGWRHMVRDPGHPDW